MAYRDRRIGRNTEGTPFVLTPAAHDLTREKARMPLIRRSGALVALAAALVAYPLTAAAQTPQTRWYLAEGATGPFFQEDILIANPGAQAATVRVQLFRETGGAPVETIYNVAATSRRRIRVNDTITEGPVAAIVESTNSVPIVVERTMYWQSLRGGHNAVGVESPSTTWYLAEGAANGFFDTFILISSPQTTATTATLRLQRDDGFTQTVQIALDPLDRETVYVNTDPRTTAFAGSSFSASVTATQPVFVERAMYFQGFEGGHDATAVTAPSTTWLFAEGFTGSGFNTFFLINNTANVAANVTLTYFLDNGTTVSRTRTIAALARGTVFVNDDSALQHTAFATRITSDQPIVAERAMYWAGFTEGHATAGVAQLAGTWGFAEGLADANFGTSFETFYLFLNPSAQPINVRGYFYREDGTGSVQDFTIAANSRHTLFGASIPGMSNEKFAAFFQSQTSGAQFLVERAVYWGQGRYGGHVSVGVPFTGALATPVAVPAPTATSISPAEGPAVGGTDVLIRGTNFAQGAQVLFGGTAAGSVIVIDNTTIFATAPPRAPGTVSVQVINRGVTMTLPDAFRYNTVAPPGVPTDPPVAQYPNPTFYPENFFAIVQQVALERGGDLRNSCGNNNFMFEVVRRLRQISQRWGLNWKRGHVGDLSQDVVTYHYGVGEPSEGSTQVYIIDIIGSHCGSNPYPTWQDQTQATRNVPTIGRWTIQPLP
jgi:hypothetical protein